MKKRKIIALVFSLMFLIAAAPMTAAVEDAATGTAKDDFAEVPASGNFVYHKCGTTCLDGCSNVFDFPRGLAVHKDYRKFYKITESGGLMLALDHMEHFSYEFERDGSLRVIDQEAYDAFTASFSCPPHDYPSDYYRNGYAHHIDCKKCGYQVEWGFHEFDESQTCTVCDYITTPLPSCKGVCFIPRALNCSP